AEGFEFGDHVARTNIEWRSRSFAIGRWRFGGALFHDGAAAWSAGAAVDWFPSVGLGLRVVIPQLGTQIRAFDLAFPLRDSPEGRAGAPVFAYGLGQSF
ncbi:MAG: hypothetical protein ACI81R_002989, partial [Bradymonadia bacterium]